MPRHNNSKVKPVSTVTPIVITKNNSLFRSIKEGFGFGLGSTIARNLFATSNNLDIRKPNCIEYKKCLESDDKYECFRNLDKKEYVECRTSNN